jgi:hypothetical protein
MPPRWPPNENSAAAGVCQPSQLAAEAVRVDVVHERALSVDLDHRQPLAVARLELGVAGDVHLGELEPELVAQRPDRLLRPLAQVAARRVIERDARYG